MSTPAAATAGPRRPARERILAAANELFYAEGVQTVGIDRIIEQAGVAKASLYNCFASKEALVQAYLRSRHERTLRRLTEAAAAAPTPREKILAVFDSQAATFTRPGFNGCAFVAASTEAPAGGLIDTEAAAYRSDVRALFTGLAAQAGAADPADLGRQLHLLYDGTGLSVRMDRDPGIAVAARSAAETLLDAALG